MTRIARIITGIAALTVVGGIGIPFLLSDSSSSSRDEERTHSGNSKPVPVSSRASGRMMSGSRVEDPLHRLEAASDEEFSETLGRIVSAWDDSKLSDDVDELFMRPASGTPMEELRSALLRRRASTEPAEAARWAMSLAREADRTSALDQVMLGWSASDPDAAFEWVKSQPDEPVRNQAWGTLAYELSRDQPSKAYDMALPLAGTPEGIQCLEHAIANWALQDPQAALDRVNELADPALRNTALASLATSWAESDPAAAGTLVSEEMIPGPSQERAVASIIQRWAQQNPQAATTWVASFPDGSMKENALALIKEQTSAKMESH